MALRNPKAALEASTVPLEHPAGRFTVREITLGTLAILEQLGSGGADAGAPWMDIVEKFYAMTHRAADCGALLADGRAAYRAAALAWADGLSPEDIQVLTQACNAASARLHAASAAAEQSGEDGDDIVQNPTAATRTGG